MNLPETVTISVIIPHAGSAEDLRSLLNSLENQKSTNPFEVLVVCNGRGKEFSFQSSRFRLNWLHSTKGANAARQRGVQAARGSVLLFFDDDCVVTDTGLLLWHQTWHSDFPQEAGVGGSYKLSMPSTVWAKTYHQIQEEWLKDYQRPDGSCVHLLGGHFSLKSWVFQKLSFDTRIVFGGTETEFQIRLAQHNLRLFQVPEKQVLHQGELNLKSFLLKAFKQGIGQGYIDSLHRRPSKYIFFSQQQVPTAPAFPKILYRFVFALGNEYFRKNKKLSVKNRNIFWEILKNTPFLFFGQLRFRELKRLQKLISLRFF